MHSPRKKRIVSLRPEPEATAEEGPSVLLATPPRSRTRRNKPKSVAAFDPHNVRESPVKYRKVSAADLPLRYLPNQSLFNDVITIGVYCAESTELSARLTGSINTYFSTASQRDLIDSDNVSLPATIYSENAQNKVFSKAHEVKAIYGLSNLNNTIDLLKQEIKKYVLTEQILLLLKSMKCYFSALRKILIKHICSITDPGKLARIELSQSGVNVEDLKKINTVLSESDNKVLLKYNKPKTEVRENVEVHIRGKYGTPSTHAPGVYTMRSFVKAGKQRRPVSARQLPLTSDDAKSNAENVIQAPPPIDRGSNSAPIKLNFAGFFQPAKTKAGARKQLDSQERRLALAGIFDLPSTTPVPSLPKVSEISANSSVSSSSVKGGEGDVSGTTTKKRKDHSTKVVDQRLAGKRSKLREGDSVASSHEGVRTTFSRF